MRHLGVNIDHVATLRQARGISYPDPVEAALLCQSAGVDSIVAHLREDRRHIQDDDILRLKKKLTIKLNLEMSIHPSVVKTALKARPDSVTFVPEKRQEKTTEAGLNAIRQKKSLKEVAAHMKAKDITVSFFIDPVFEQIDAAKACGADAVEIHTGSYANATTKLQSQKELQKLKLAVERALSLNLVTHAGHGLDYRNVGAVAGIPGITEFNIGFSIIARSVFVGLEAAVKEMRIQIKGVAASAL